MMSMSTENKRRTKTIKLPSAEREREIMDELFETVSYHHTEPVERDEHGMPVVDPEPNDPDDE